MSNKKYEFVEQALFQIGNEQVTLNRIRALRQLNPHRKKDCVHIGDLGGWVESEANLSQEDNCWIDDNSIVLKNGLVKDNAYICGTSIVNDHAVVCDNALIAEHSYVTDDVIICDYASVVFKSTVRGALTLKDNVYIEQVAMDSLWIPDEPRDEGSIELNRQIIGGSLYCKGSCDHIADESFDEYPHIKKLK